MSYRFFQNKSCEFFPCHKVTKQGEFNCLFCYCPLYFLGDKCGGNYSYLDNGVKDCANCTFPHMKDNYDIILDKLKKACEKK